MKLLILKDMDLKIPGFKNAIKFCFTGNNFPPLCPYKRHESSLTSLLIWSSQISGQVGSSWCRVAEQTAEDCTLQFGIWNSWEQFGKMASPGYSAFSNDGQYLANCGIDGKLKIYETATNRLKTDYVPNHHLKSPCSILRWITVSLQSSSTTVCHVVFIFSYPISPDSSKISNPLFVPKYCWYFVFLLPFFANYSNNFFETISHYSRRQKSEVMCLCI